ncbi:hypothetical protein SOVF_005190 [Spinacia oleracea]|uniref:Uncharacterized membrane protein At1g16860 n=1 Tax=Spinacia oleracea TaxID=3562 RepID=A0A9R0HRJ2_SPIOL|nr:uncharacterized membrane protein At1g16860 [Spinacia oleracea]KNA25592.1 hypothetical protein SOVF_005190 [Spinacia oleracea]
MGSRTQSHQLRSGLYVSGRRDTLPKERPPTMAARAVPYTGGDIKKSGELGKMFDITTTSTTATSSSSLSLSSPRPPPSRASSQPNSGSARSGPNSGQLPPRLSNSGSFTKKSSGPLSIPPTGLITSGPIRKSGQLDGSGLAQPQLAPAVGGSGKMVYGTSVTSLGSEKVKYGLRVSRGAMWVFGIVVLMGLLVGVFLMVAVKKAVMLVVFAAILVPIFVGLGWNYAWGKRAILGFVKKFPDAELRGAVDGQFVKVTGVVTCGSIPLESSFQRVPRCVYVSTELYEYKGCGGKSANTKHRCLSWGCRHSEKYVADFYVSDFHSGLRALVKTGYGAKVAPLVEPATVVDITKEKRDLSPNFLQWLADRSLSSDDRIMRLKEGYVKEGSTVSVMGIVRRHENILMIVPPTEAISTGCQWLRCLLPMYIEGLVLHCEDNQNSEVIPV